MEDTPMDAPWLFKRFTIPYKKADARCQARMRRNGQETYCNIEANGERCREHDVNKRRRAALEREKALAKVKVVDAHKLWSGAIALFERRITDARTRHAVVADFGLLLDDLTQAATHRESDALAPTASRSDTQPLDSDAQGMPQGEHGDG